MPVIHRHIRLLSFWKNKNPRPLGTGNPWCHPNEAKNPIVEDGVASLTFSRAR
ncbi:MAG: hypothetical protein HYX86_05800 [Chloroflexi bacterium]|nr:hypothetical protein [Chloroflexota bacterium]